LITIILPGSRRHCFWRAKTLNSAEVANRTQPPLSNPMKVIIPLLVLFVAVFSPAEELYQMPSSADSRVSSFENLNGVKGQGAQANRGAKGRAFEPVRAGENKTLLEVQGSGLIQRIWLTVQDRSPAMLRALRLQMYWDGAATPAVDVPLGDFFCAETGQPTAFQSAFFSNPEGRSFNCYVTMPFSTGARIVLKNENTRDLSHLFFDVDFVLQPFPKDALYFHAYWSRQKSSAVGQDFTVLPKVTGRGRYLGASIGVNCNPAYPGTWYGEGEMKLFLDGDDSRPTIAGTGTEDYIGTGWGEGIFAQLYQGCLVADGKEGRYCFYRFHVPDAIYFHRDCQVRLQQIGGGERDLILGLLAKGASLRPISADIGGSLVRLLDETPAPDLHADKFAKAWVNFYRSDDYAATAYFYLDRPAHDLKPLAPLAERWP
jgi:hypothetical protein